MGAVPSCQRKLAPRASVLAYGSASWIPGLALLARNDVGTTSFYSFGATMRNTLRMTSEALTYGAAWLMSQTSA